MLFDNLMASQSIRTRIDPVGDTESGCELGRWPFAEARLGPINSCALKYFTYVSRLGSGLEAFSHNPSSGTHSIRTIFCARITLA